MRGNILGSVTGASPIASRPLFEPNNRWRGQQGDYNAPWPMNGAFSFSLKAILSAS
jgi:hypothetical protein